MAPSVSPRRDSADAKFLLAAGPAEKFDVYLRFRQMAGSASFLEKSWGRGNPAFEKLYRLGAGINGVDLCTLAYHCGVKRSFKGENPWKDSQERCSC